MPVKLVIFDLDGTLVDTSVDITNSLNHAVVPVGIKPLTVPETISLVGEGINTLIDKVLGPGKAHLSEHAMKRFIEHYSTHLSDFSTIYPGVAKTLENLDGFKKSVVTNKREDLSRRLLDELGIGGYFDLVVGSDTTGQRKPSPVPLEHVLKTLGIVAEEAVMVGDSDIDVSTARSAGVTSIAVTSGYRSADVLKDADYMIASMDELIRKLYGNMDVVNRRQDARVVVPDDVRVDMKLELIVGDERIPVEILDMSRRGLKFRCPAPLYSGDVHDCEISAHQALSSSTRAKVQVRHCAHLGIASYFVGARTVDISGDKWFRVFEKISEYIKQRKGNVY